MIHVLAGTGTATKALLSSMRSKAVRLFIWGSPGMSHIPLCAFCQRGGIDNLAPSHTASIMIHAGFYALVPTQRREVDRPPEEGR